jgi:hypothetical protein
LRIVDSACLLQAGVAELKKNKRLNIGENRKLDIDRQGYYFKLNMEDFKNDSSEDMVSMCGHA